MGFLDSTPLRDILYNPKKNEEKGAEGAQAGLEQWGKVQPTEFGQMNFQGPQQASDVNYSNVNAQTMGPNAYDQINVNPELQQTQMAQLAALQQLQQNGGMNAQDKANLNAIQMQENQNEAGNRAAILQNANMRGTANSGNSLLAQLVSQQGSANRQNQNDLNVAGMAQNRALTAGGQAANLAGNMQNQSFQQQAQQAAAQNAINQFNAQAGNQVGMYNAGQGLQAQQFNANKNQGVLNAQSAAQNQNELYNNYMIPQTQYQQQAGIASGMSGAGANQANYYNNLNAMKTKSQNGIWGGMGQMGSGIMSSFAGGGGMGGGGGSAKPGMSSSGGSGSSGQASADGSGEGYDGGGGYEGGGESETAGTEYNTAHGGKIPGMSRVPGDSLENDSMILHVSPGEVVVPKSLTDAPASKIGDFVHNAPPVTIPDKKRAAMLSALKHIRQKGGR